MNDKRLDIAIIMDGNRRWAKAKNLPSHEGHSKGAEKLEEVLKWCKKINANSLTLYTFSTENFKRTLQEKEHIFNLFRKYYTKLSKDIEKSKDNDLKIKFLGNLDLFPTDIKELCLDIQKKTQENDKYLLQFCFGYGGKNEILNAVKKIIHDKITSDEIDEKLFEKYLYTCVNPDIVIRTSGEKRMSNFLPWQTAYSELFFTDTFWPDFSENEFYDIIEEYKKRNKRIGK